MVMVGVVMRQNWCSQVNESGGRSLGEDGRLSINGCGVLYLAAVGKIRAAGCGVDV